MISRFTRILGKQSHSVTGSTLITDSLRRTVVGILLSLPALFLYSCYLAGMQRLSGIHNECIRGCRDDAAISLRYNQLSKVRITSVALNMYKKICMNNCENELESNYGAVAQIQLVAIGLLLWYLICFTAAVMAH